MTVALVLLPRILPAIAPATAPTPTFCTSLLVGSSLTRSTLADVTLASTGYVFPPYVTEFTANSMTIASFAFSLRLSWVIVKLTVAPAGTSAPFEPDTELSSVAVTWSPTALEFVQIFDDACVLSVEPAAIVPTAPPPAVDAFAGGFVVTVFPLGVVLVVGRDAAGAF